MARGDAIITDPRGKDERNAAAGEFVGDLEDIGAMQANIEYRAIDAPAAKQTQRVKGCRRRAQHSGAELAQIATDVGGQKVVVFDHQNAFAAKVNICMHVTPR